MQFLKCLKRRLVQRTGQRQKPTVRPRLQIADFPVEHDLARRIVHLRALRRRICEHPIHIYLSGILHRERKLQVLCIAARYQRVFAEIHIVAVGRLSGRIRDSQRSLIGHRLHSVHFIINDVLIRDLLEGDEREGVELHTAAENHQMQLFKRLKRRVVQRTGQRQKPAVRPRLQFADFPVEHDLARRIVHLRALRRRICEHPIHIYLSGILHRERKLQVLCIAARYRRVFAEIHIVAVSRFGG